MRAHTRHTATATAAAGQNLKTATTAGMCDRVSDIFC